MLKLNTSVLSEWLFPYLDIISNFEHTSSNCDVQNSLDIVCCMYSCMCIFAGRQFDINGNAKQWWSKEVIEKFNQRAQCIVNQYSSYTVSEVGMNVSKIMSFSWYDPLVARTRPICNMKVA